MKRATFPDFDRFLGRQRNDRLLREVRTRCLVKPSRANHAQSAGLRRPFRASALGWALGSLYASFSEWYRRLARDRIWRISVERTAPTEAELAAMHEEAAERWHDQLALVGYPQAYEDLFDSLLADGALNSLRDGGRVLDFGVGTGAFSLALAGKVAAPLRIEVVELSPSMLLRASLNLDRVGVEARLHLRGAKGLPFEDNTFDAVIGAHVLEHLDDPFAGLSGMVRVLKPGGPLVVVATRRVVPDALLHPKWRHEHIAQDRLTFGMEGAGLIGVRVYPLLAGGPLPRRTSVACVGFKEGVWQWSDT
jgi:SAM-dependent methyltransferase